MDDPQRELSPELVRICAQQTDLSMEELIKFRTHNFHNVSETTQCFTQCLYEEMGLMKDGVFVDKDFLSALSDQINPGCPIIHSDNKCEMAFWVHQCKLQLKNPILTTELAKTEGTTTELTSGPLQGTT